MPQAMWQYCACARSRFSTCKTFHVAGVWLFMAFCSAPNLCVCCTKMEI